MKNYTFSFVWRMGIFIFCNFKSVFNNKIPDTRTIIKPMSKANVLFITNYEPILQFYIILIIL